MADELLDLEEDQEVNKAEKRIKDLSEKVKLTAQERDELAKTKETLDQEKASLTKEVDFYKNLSPLTAKYPGAAEYQDRIREKVLTGGYEAEDAIISILAKEGKLTTPVVAAEVVRENPAGGSATNTIKAGGDKSVSEMSRDEKRAALLEAEGKGDFSIS